MVSIINWLEIELELASCAVISKACQDARSTTGGIGVTVLSDCNLEDEDHVAFDQILPARHRNVRPPGRAAERARVEGIAAEVQISGVTKTPSRLGLEGVFV